MRFLDHLPGPQRSGEPVSPTTLVTPTALAAQTLAALAAGLPVVRRQSTNVLNYPYFNENKWTKDGALADLVQELLNIVTVGSTQSYFDYRVLQISAIGGSNALASHPYNVPIDLNQPYRIALYGVVVGSLAMTILVDAIDINGAVISTLTITTPAMPAAFADNTAEVGTTINAVGGGAPAWPAATTAARIRLQNVNSGSNKIIAGVWLIQTQRLINTSTTKSGATNGGGTHEAWWDGTNLYTISHTFGQMAKFDINLVRQAIVTTNVYPHDIVGLGADVWVINHDGKSLQQINRSAMTVTNTFALNGSRSGFGIATDGTDLYLGIGNSGLGETPAIVKFTVASSAQTVLSTDVQGGGANIPVVVQNSSIWSIHQTNAQVKRYNPAGTTLATIATGISNIYGLGGDGTLIYAAGVLGVAVIDPTTNTVVSTYFFSKQNGMSGNPRVDSWGRIWGCSRNGLWVLNQATGIFTEIPGVLGGVKWTRPMANGAVAVGFYGVPSIDLY